VADDLLQFFVPILQLNRVSALDIQGILLGDKLIKVVHHKIRVDRQVRRVESVFNAPNFLWSCPFASGGSFLSLPHVINLLQFCVVLNLLLLGYVLRHIHRANS